MSTLRQNISASFQRQFGRMPTNAEIDEMISRRQQQGQPNIPQSPSTAEQLGRTALTAGTVSLGKAGAKAAYDALTGGAAASPAVAPAAPTAIGAERVVTAAAPTQAATPTAQAGFGSTLGNVAGVAGGLYSAYELGQGLKDASQYQQSGRDLAMTTGTSALQGAGVGGGVAAGLGLLGATGFGLLPALAIGALLGGGAGLGAGLMGSGKKQDQIMRDEIRKNYRDAGLIGQDDYMLDGFDIGRDGGFRTDRGTRIQEVDFTKQGAREAVGALNPLGWLTSGIEDQEMKGMSTGMLYNALSADNGVTMDEVRGLYDKAGLNQASAFEGITELFNEGILTEEEARSGQAALNELYGQEYFSPEDEAERRRLADEGLSFLLDQ